MLIRRILVVINAGPFSEPAVARAAALARARGASLRFAECFYEADAAGERFGESAEIDALRADLVQARRAALEDIARPLRTDGAEVSVSATWSRPPCAGYLAQAQEFGADLLVMNPPRDPASGRLALGYADWEILRKSPCPVLLTGGGTPRAYREILVAVDPLHSHDKPAALDDALIAGARALADGAGARIGLLHCYLPPQYLPLRAPGGAPSGLFHHRESALDAHREGLMSWRAATPSRRRRRGLSRAMPGKRYPRRLFRRAPTWWSWVPSPAAGSAAC